MGTKSRELSTMRKGRVSSMRPSPKQSLWIKKSNENSIYASPVSGGNQSVNFDEISYDYHD
tara:strand:- start:72 stop:254 length:183 start_codon:yes stop_codon:yes gene_type:complete